FEKDIFVNVISGLKIDEPASDLATAVAIASSMWEVPVPADMAFVGELGLSGELRAVSQTAMRIREPAKLGSQRVVDPTATRSEDLGQIDAAIIRDRSLATALEVALPGERRD